VPPAGMGCERISQRKTVLAVASFLAAAALLCACGKHEATSSDSPGVAEITKKWEFTTGGIISGGLALAEDGSLYAACEDGFVYALDPNGKLQWKMYIGPTESTPVIVSDGSVLVSNNHGRLFALNHSGDIRWQTDLYDGNTLNKNAGALGREYFYVPSRGNLSAARLTNGQVDWQSGWGGDQWGSVTLTPDGNLLSPGRGRLTALDSSGRVAWQYPPLTPEAIQRNGGFALTPASFFVSSGIAVDADRHMYAGIGRTKFVAMGPDGSIKWEVKMDPKTQGSEINRSSPVIAADGTIYFASSDSTLYAVDSFGTTKWKFQLRGPAQATPLLTQDGSIFVVTGRFLSAVSPAGELIAQAAAGSGAESSPTIALDGTIYVATYDFKVIAYAGSHGGLMNSPWPKFQADVANTGNAHTF
jgi:outer membrane protein assembly factor BamB